MSLEERLNRARGARGTSSVAVQAPTSPQQSQGAGEGASRPVVARPQAAARRVAASSAGMVAPATSTSRYGDLRKNL